MKNFVAYFLPMMSKQAAKFEQGGEHAMVPSQHPKLYAELDRRLAAMLGIPNGSQEVLDNQS